MFRFSKITPRIQRFQILTSSHLQQALSVVSLKACIKAATSLCSIHFWLCEITAMVTFDKCSVFHAQCAQIRYLPVSTFYSCMHPRYITPVALPAATSLFLGLGLHVVQKKPAPFCDADLHRSIRR